jgi:hypothetical protein
LRRALQVRGPSPRTKRRERTCSLSFAPLSNGGRRRPLRGFGRKRGRVSAVRRHNRMPSSPRNAWLPAFIRGDVALQVLLPMNRPAPDGVPPPPVVLPDPSGAPDPLTRNKGQRGPLCAVANGVGERSHKTGMVPGGSGESLALTTPPCQQESWPQSAERNASSRPRTVMREVFDYVDLRFRGWKAHPYPGLNSSRADITISSGTPAFRRPPRPRSCDRVAM